MINHEIRSDIEAIENEAALYEEINFDGRLEAIDYLEFNVIDRIEGLLLTTKSPEELSALQQHAQSVKRRLEDIDDSLFQRLRADIRMGRFTGTAFRDRVDSYVGRDASAVREQDEVGYDSLDVFVNRLVFTQAIPAETKAREPEMVYYQKTPTRMIFELVEHACLTGGDVFYDLGSGLGQVPILVNLLSGVTARGVEFEPAYCDYARECAAALNLPHVAFIHADARAADYSEGTVFFMYTPFEGIILQEMLERLRAEARNRTIRLFTYGPCTPQVSRQRWLASVNQHGDHVYKLGAFRSL